MNLVKIDMKTLQHTAYEGGKRIASAQFTRALLADEVEAFRKNPAGFLEGTEDADDATQEGAA